MAFFQNLKSLRSQRIYQSQLCYGYVDSTIVVGDKHTLGSPAGSPPTSLFGSIIGGTTHEVSGGNSLVVGGSNVGGFGNSVVCGSNNTGSHADSLFGGTSNTVSGGSLSSAIICGTQNVVAGSAVLCCGIQNTINTNNAIIWGKLNNVTGEASFGGGNHCQVNHSFEFAMGAGLQNSTDFRQSGMMQAIINTAGNTPTEILIGGAGASRITIENNSAYKFNIFVIAVNAGATGGTAGDVVSFSGSGTIKNIGGTTTLINAVVMTQDDADASLVTTAVTVTADNVNDSLKIEVTGNTGETIRWLARVDYERITF